uniref:Uncharacterized protein n=1 Tax=Meloidogyne enterolobii TaxID=390850 RepID=A0A6V7X3P4_MELEN|nr:unnamed protein product [Meloidogyne enterolobii]
MSKFNLIVLLYLIILLNIHCVGKPIRVSLKIKDNWEEKREFIYLKDVELKERFVVKTIEKHNNHYFGSNYNMEGFTSLVDLDLASNIFKNVELNVGRRNDPNYLLKMKIVIEIANNKFVRNFSPEFDKQALRFNNFTEVDNVCETSILEETLENTKINKKELLKENIENYKNKLLSSFWTEINLIGYKIELLEKQKVEYPKELNNRIIYFGNKITGLIEVSKRMCFNCRVTQTKQWLEKKNYNG